MCYCLSAETTVCCRCVGAPTPPGQVAGGPNIPMRYGRQDVDDAKDCAPEGRLPCESMALGESVQEMVGHSSASAGRQGTPQAGTLLLLVRSVMETLAVDATRLPFSASGKRVTDSNGTGHPA